MDLLVLAQRFDIEQCRPQTRARIEMLLAKALRRQGASKAARTLAERAYRRHATTTNLEALLGILWETRQLARHQRLLRQHQQPLGRVRTTLDASILAHWAETYSVHGDQQRADCYNKVAHDILRDAHPRGAACRVMNHGTFLWQRQAFRDAACCYLLAAEAFDKVEDCFLRAASFLWAGGALLEQPSKVARRETAHVAAANLEIGISVLQRTQTQVHLSAAYRQLARAYEVVGDMAGRLSALRRQAAYASAHKAVRGRRALRLPGGPPRYVEEDDDWVRPIVGVPNIQGVPPDWLPR